MAWKLLLTSDMGLLSLLTLAIMLGMPVFIAFYVRGRMGNKLGGLPFGDCSVPTGDEKFPLKSVPYIKIVNFS